MKIMEFVNVVGTCNTNTFGLLLPISYKYDELVDIFRAGPS